MRPRPDLLDDDSAAGLEVFQLTAEPDVPASHLYMEAQVFTPDSQRLIIHRSAHAHGSDRHDPEHHYLLCDLANSGELSPIVTELGVTGASVSPDGRYVNYFVDQTELGGGKLSLRRVGLDGTDRQTILVIDSPLPGTHYRPSHIYPLSTISSDGQRIAISAFLGDGRTENAPWGLMVFDIRAATVELILHGPTWCNVHPQYCRSLDPAASHDILVQENHDNTTGARGNITLLVGGDGADIHVIRDDGSALRNMPWGRDGNEYCQGHQCWRGRSTWAVTSTSTRRPAEAQLIEATAAPYAGHVGLHTPGGVRNDLSRSFARPGFCHFATDIAGRRLITDSVPLTDGGRLYLAEFGEPGRDALTNWRYLLNPRSTGGKDSHVHPFLSPDGRLGFFNSDESGRLQAYLVRGW